METLLAKKNNDISEEICSHIFHFTYPLMQNSNNSLQNIPILQCTKIHTKQIEN